MEIEREKKEYIVEKEKNRQHGKFHSEGVQTLEFSKPSSDFKIPFLCPSLSHSSPPIFENSNYEEKVLQRDATKSSKGYEAFY